MTFYFNSRKNRDLQFSENNVNEKLYNIQNFKIIKCEYDKILKTLVYQGL